MTTFQMRKPVDEIEEPLLLPEEWYHLRVVKAPEIKPNKKKLDGMSYEDGAGDNLIISLRVESDDPDTNGRAFTAYLPFPGEEDLEARDGRGMCKYDAKMERLAEFAEAAQGSSVEGNEINIEPNSLVQIYVSVGMDQSGTKPINQLDTFGGFKPPAEYDEGLDSPTIPDDDIPF